MDHPSHHHVLERARSWRMTSDRDNLLLAQRSLEAAMSDFPYVLALGNELVLVLERLNELDQAVELLRKLERQFRFLNEETLCRWGKLFKRRGEIAAKDSSGNVRSMIEFDQAERYYQRAFELYHGYYSRINELSVRFVRASLIHGFGHPETSTAIVSNVRKSAFDLLSDTDAWRRNQDDDEIWATATRAEIRLLNEEWGAAASEYLEAIKIANNRHFFVDSISHQVSLLVDAYYRLKITPDGPFASLDRFLQFCRTGRSA